MKNNKDSRQIAIPQNTIAAGRRHTVGLKSNGTVMAAGDSKYGQCDVNGWHGIQIPGK